MLFFFLPFTGGLMAQLRRRLNAAHLLGQDEDLHDEYAAEYEAGAGDVVLERRERCGSVLLGGEKGESW